MEVKLLLQVVFLRLWPRRLRGPPFLPPPLVALQDAPLDVVADGLQQNVRAVHVTVLVKIGPAIAVGGVDILRVVQRDVPEQVGHHHRLVHVVDSKNEAVHGAEERLLLIVGFRYLHHGVRRAAESLVTSATAGAKLSPVRVFRGLVSGRGLRTAFTGL